MIVAWRQVERKLGAIEGAKAPKGSIHLQNGEPPKTSEERIAAWRRRIAARQKRRDRARVAAMQKAAGV